MSEKMAVLNIRQTRAIAALIRHATVADAAQETGVNASTIFRWLQDGQFLAALREARRQVVEHAITAMQARSSEAVKALERNLTCGNAFAEITAARAILDYSLKGVELTDLAARLEELEKMNEIREKAETARIRKLKEGTKSQKLR